MNRVPIKNFLTRKDGWITISLFVFVLILYLRTLAPDILYGDSGEFQTLAYTLGYTHSTGYPIYLLIARLVGFIPFGNLAWRISLFSAISAALSASLVYLVARRFTNNPIGPVLSSLLLAISYTFWSQAIIAEVYTPGTAFVALILFLLLYWVDEPVLRRKFLFGAALFTVSGVGVHASVGLLSISAVLFVLWTALQYRTKPEEAKKIIGSAVGGTVVGLMVLILAFLLIDLNNPKSSFVNVMLQPSRSIWGLQASDLDSPLERAKLTLIGKQWQPAMFPESIDMVVEFGEYLGSFAILEFSWGWLFICLISLYYHVSKQPIKGVFVLLTLLIMLFFILNYEPPDKYLFFLPSYIVLLAIGGAGIGSFYEGLSSRLKFKTGVSFLFQTLLTIAIFAWVMGSDIESRLQAVKTGVAGFVQEDYVFPVEKLGEPRAVAILYLSSLPDNAVLIMDWRPLYATYFVAHVEGRNPSLQIYEAMPYGNRGKLAESLIETLEMALVDKKPVFSTELFSGVVENFTVKRLSGTGLYQLWHK